MSKIYKCDICNVNYPPPKDSGLPQLKTQYEFENRIKEWLVDNRNNQYYILSGFNTIVLTENELIKRGLNPQHYEIVRDYVSEMEYIE